MLVLVLVLVLSEAVLVLDCGWERGERFAVQDRLDGKPHPLAAARFRVRVPACGLSTSTIERKDRMPERNAIYGGTSRAGIDRALNFVARWRASFQIGAIRSVRFYQHVAVWGQAGKRRLSRRGTLHRASCTFYPRFQQPGVIIDTILTLQVLDQRSLLRLGVPPGTAIVQVIQHTKPTRLGDFADQSQSITIARRAANRILVFVVDGITKPRVVDRLVRIVQLPSRRIEGDRLQNLLATVHVGGLPATTPTAEMANLRQLKNSPAS